MCHAHRACFPEQLYTELRNSRQSRISQLSRYDRSAGYGLAGWG